MKSFKIVITEPEDFSIKAIKILQAKGEVFLLPSIDLIDSFIGSANVLMIRLGINWTAEMLAKAPELKYILTPTTGLDHIDLDYTEEKGIKVISLKGEQAFLDSIPATAELSFALLLAILRKLVFAHQHVLDDGWNRQAYRGNNLKGKKLGILGFGRIGHQMANYALAFGMKVATYDPSSNYSNSKVVFKKTPKELFSDSEIISIHIPMNEQNNHFVSAEMLKSSKKGQVIINTSRGGVWDEEAIAEGLINGVLGAVATDVIENEIEPELRKKSKLIELAKAGYSIIITPHIGGATFESMHETEDFIATKFINNNN